MPKQNDELENSQNSEELEEFLDDDFEDIPEEGEKTPKKEDVSVEDLKEKNKRLYARLKKAEAKLKGGKEEKAPSAPPATIDPVEIAKTVSALKDYSPEEVDYIALIAKAKGISLQEAQQTDEVKIYIEARRQKLVTETQTPEPSTKQPPTKKSFEDYTFEDVQKLSVDEKLKYYEWKKKQAKRQI